MMVYLLLKWIHVLAAITALGANITYAIWLNRMNSSTQLTLFTLNTIRILDGRLANPAYILSLVTGVSMVLIGEWSLTTPWIVTALVLYVIVALVGMFRFSPLLRRQIQLAETAGLESGEYITTARQGMITGAVVVLLVVVIVFLMVVKPGLWG